MPSIALFPLSSRAQRRTSRVNDHVSFRGGLFETFARWFVLTMTDATTLLNSIMRYLVKAKVNEGKHGALLRAIENETLGHGSIAGDEYRYNMEQARVAPDGTARWIETCFCDPPLAEEQPYWEKYFELLSVKDAHSRRNCRHENGTEAWACCDCDCTRKLEEKLQKEDESFLQKLRSSLIEGLSSLPSP